MRPELAEAAELIVPAARALGEKIPGTTYPGIKSSQVTHVLPSFSSCHCVLISAEAAYAESDVNQISY